MLQYLKQESNKTFTENGAATLKSTQSDCLDLFATIGAIRRESDEEITARFIRAFTEDTDNLRRWHPNGRKSCLTTVYKKNGSKKLKLAAIFVVYDCSNLSFSLTLIVA